MSMYDDLLKQMQGSFMQNNPKMFGNQGGFTSSNFGFNDPDVIKPGGGVTGGGTGGTDGDVPGPTGPTGPTGTQGSSNYGATSYGGQFQSQFSGVEDVLSGIGESGFNLFDPAQQFGYGSEYSEYFGSFDVGGYNQSMQALQDQQSRLLSDVGQQYQSRTTGMQSDLQDTLLGMIGKESTSGLVGGRQAQRRQLTREAGQQNLEKLGQETQARYAGVQERIGQQIGILEGSLMDFISDQSNRALTLMQSGATKDKSTEANTGWAAQPKGSPMTATQLSQYQGIFGDLTNSQQAFAAFVQNAHSNLDESQLSELAQSIYAQYQGNEESGEENG